MEQGDDNKQLDAESARGTGPLSQEGISWRKTVQKICQAIEEGVQVLERYAKGRAESEDRGRFGQRSESVRGL